MRPLLFTLMFVLISGSSALANDLDTLQGKWTCKKKGDNGPMTQTLEFKKDKWTFWLAVEGGSGFVAKGETEIKKAGAFNTVRFHVTKFGPTENELEEADVDRNMVFTLQDGKLYLANNFDQQRENENPIVDVYSKTAEAAKASSEIVGNWKLNLELGETTYDYTLRVTENAGKLNAVLVSPRSGEHRVKMVSLEKDEFKMGVDREIEGTPMTFVYTGKLEGNNLSGKATVKGASEDLSGTWTAKK